MRTIVFEPKPLDSPEPSYVLGIRLSFSVIDSSVRFLTDTAFSSDPVKAGDHHVEMFWQSLLRISGTTLATEGREDIGQGPFVFMSNHLSLFDVPTILGAIPPPVRMAAKAELLSIPIFGKALERSGFIIIDRANRVKAITQLEKAKEHLRAGINVWIAPEGTRKRDPNIDLQPFKKGGFYTAIDLEVPIVPLWIEGSDKVIAADSHLVNPNQTITVHFGKPIVTKGMTKSDIPELMKRVRDAMLELKPPMV